MAEAILSLKWASWHKEQATLSTFFLHSIFILVQTVCHKLRHKRMKQGQAIKQRTSFGDCTCPICHTGKILLLPIYCKELKRATLEVLGNNYTEARKRQSKALRNDNDQALLLHAVASLISFYLYTVLSSPCFKVMSRLAQTCPQLRQAVFEIAFFCWPPALCTLHVMPIKFIVYCSQSR